MAGSRDAPVFSSLFSAVKVIQEGTLQRCNTVAMQARYIEKLTYRFVFNVPENYRAFPEN